MNGTIEVLQAHPQTMIPAGYGSNFSPTQWQPTLVGVPPKKKAWAIPCLGILVVFFSLFLPYISVLGFNLTGFETIELFLEGLSDNGDDGIIEGGMDEAPLLMIAFLMLTLGPIFYSLMALFSTFSMLFESHPLLLGIIHTLYFGGFMLCSFLSAVDLGFLGSYSVHGDVTGIGFFVGGIAGILFCIKV